MMQLGLGAAGAGFLPFIIPFIAGAISEPLFEFFQKQSPFIDKLPVWFKRVASPTLSYWLNWAGMGLGVWTSMIDPTTMTMEQLTGFLAAGLAFIHKQANNRGINR